MLTLFEFVGLILLFIGFAYVRMPRWLWTPLVASILVLVSVYSEMSWWLLSPLWIIYAAFFLFFNIKPIRYKFITKPLLTNIKKLLPPMSSTEREALEAGDVWWEGELFCGHPRFKKLISMPKPTLTKEEQDFIDN